MKSKKSDCGQMETVCYQYFVQERKMAEIATTIKKDVSFVTRLIQQARERGVVHTTVDASFCLFGVENARQALKLSREYRLDSSIVIDIEDTEDNLHIALANHVGTGVRRCINSGEHLAVAGGRAIVRLATVIARTCQPQSEITVSPLSGRLWNGRLWELKPSRSVAVPTTHLEQPLNADYSALILATGLHGGYASQVKFSQISHPLYLQSQNLVNAIMKSNCPFLPDGTWNWTLNTPRRAFVGVGSVHPKSSHRMMQTLRDGKQKRNLEPPFDQIRRAVNIVSSKNLPHFADVANRLFAVLPLPDALRKLPLNTITKAYGELTSVLAEINSRALVMNWDHLEGIQHVYAIAGGEIKLQALFTLLLAGLNGRRILKQLATDGKTASQLIDALDAYRALPAALQKWYADMLKLSLSGKRH